MFQIHDAVAKGLQLCDEGGARLDPAQTCAGVPSGARVVLGCGAFAALWPHYAVTALRGKGSTSLHTRSRSLSLALSCSLLLSLSLSCSLSLALLGFSLSLLSATIFSS